MEQLRRFFHFCHVDNRFLRCHKIDSIVKETFWWQGLKRHDVQIWHCCHLYNQMTRAEHRLWLAAIWSPCRKSSGLQTRWCCRLDNGLVFRKQATWGSFWGKPLCSKTKKKDWAQEKYWACQDLKLCLFRRRFIKISITQDKSLGKLR